MRRKESFNLNERKGRRAAKGEDQDKDNEKEKQKENKKKEEKRERKQEETSEDINTSTIKQSPPQFPNTHSYRNVHV